MAPGASPATLSSSRECLPETRTEYTNAQAGLTAEVNSARPGGNYEWSRSSSSGRGQTQMPRGRRNDSLYQARPDRGLGVQDSPLGHQHVQGPAEDESHPRR